MLLVCLPCLVMSFLVPAGSIIIHIPSTQPAPGVWSADVHSKCLAQLPHQLYTSSASSLSASQSTLLSASPAAPNNWRLQSDLQAQPQSAAAEVATSGVISSAGQRVSHCQHGMQVQSNLLQGATFTAVLELITGIGRVQNGLRRMYRLMESQQQHLQQLLMHRQVAGAKLTQVQHLPAVKSETDTALHHQDHIADSAARAVKLEEHHPKSSQPGTADGQFAGVKSEDGETGNVSTETGNVPTDNGGMQAAASGRRRPVQRLAWHVVSSGVVEVAHVGLNLAVLEVCPPPPWSHASLSFQPKTENEASLSPNPDTDVQQPSTRSDHFVVQQPRSKLHTADQHDTPPVPFLTIRMQWKLTTGQSLEQDAQHEPQHPPFSTSVALQTAPQEQPLSQGQPSSQGLSASQGLPLPRELPQSQGLPPLHPHSAVDKAKHATDAARSEGQGIPEGVPRAIPNLRCCMHSEPELPLQILESFQDMAGLSY